MRRLKFVNQEGVTKNDRFSFMKRYYTRLFYNPRYSLEFKFLSRNRGSLSSNSWDPESSLCYSDMRFLGLGPTAGLSLSISATILFWSTDRVSKEYPIPQFGSAAFSLLPSVSSCRSPLRCRMHPHELPRCCPALHLRSSCFCLKLLRVLDGGWCIVVDSSYLVWGVKRL